MLAAAATVFAVTWLSYAVALRAYRRFRLLDFPERYALKRTERLPYPTGLVAVTVFVCAMAVLLPFREKELGLLAAVALLAITSFTDDRTPLPSWVRLCVQIAVAVILFVTGSRIYSITNPLGGVLKLDSVSLDIAFFGSLPVLSGLFTLGWLLLTINALNWLDGVSGQVSLLSTIGFLMLGSLALFRNGETEIALIAFILAAIAGAGALFDFPPSKMLIGDTGSMFFGLMLGLLGIYHGGKVATVFLALGLPLLDALFVVLGRIARGHSPFRGGQDHLHHRLLRCGWTERQIVALTAVVGMTFGVAALFLSTPGKGIAALLLVAVVLTLRLLTGSSTARTPSEHSQSQTPRA